MFDKKPSEFNKEHIKILLVEDSIFDAAVIEEMLSSVKGRRFKIIRAEDLSEARRILSEESFNIILLDLNLPDSTGLDTFTEITGHSPHTPVIILTGDADEEMAVKALREGVQDYLIKGQIDLNLLEHSISYSIERKASVMEKKEAEEALKETMLKYQLFFNAESDSLIVHEIESGKILEVNLAATGMYCYTQEEFLSIKIFDLSAEPEETMRVINDPSVSYVPLRYHKKKDGTVFPVEIASSRINIKGRFVRLAAIRDISSRIKVEEELKNYSEKLEDIVKQKTGELEETREKLIRQEKLAVMGKLAGSVSHELRNPLGTISNAAYFLNMVLSGGDDTVKDYLKIISEEVRKSDKIISDLLDFSRIKSIDKEEVPPRKLVLDALKNYLPPEKIKIINNVSEELPCVYADPHHIVQILGNLIINAYQAMPEGGEVIIDAEVSKDCMNLSVSDTGYGISEEHMKKIFEPLFTTKPRGIGLGLSVCKNLSEANGGKIDVKSIEKQGTTFTVILPVKE